jgi:glycosyltransferase involved in cell wall biosynthesis
MLKKLKSIVIVGFTHRKGEGGGNIHINNLIPFWESSGIKVIIFDPVNVNKFDLISVLKATFQAAIFKICHVLEANNADLIISESPYPPDVITAYRLSRKYMKPMAIYLHHISPPVSVYPFRRGILRVLLNVIYTSFLLSFVKKFKIPIFLDNPNTLENYEGSVFPNLIALSRRNSDDEPNVIRSYFDYDICYVGRIENHKGVEDFVEVISILKNKYSMNLRAVIAGKGKESYVKRIEKMIGRLGLSENIIMKGFIQEAEKFQLLKRSRMFLFLSYEEGWSISVMEAASVGIPIVAYALPAYYYLKDNYFSIPIGNIETCARTIKNILNNYAMAKETAMRAKKCVEIFSYDFIAKQQLIFFGKITKNFLHDQM